MKRSEVEDKLADYAFGTMSAHERTIFAVELANYPDLLAEYEHNWQPLITVLPLGVEPLQLPAALRSRVLNATFRGESSQVMQQAVTVGATMQRVAPYTAERLSWWRKLVVRFSRPQVVMPLLMMMLIVTLASTAWGFSSNATLARERSYVAAEQQELDALLADRTVRMVVMQTTDYWKNGVATATYAPNKNAVYISLNGPLPKYTMDCQVWAQKQGQTISLGTFRMTTAAAGYLMYAPQAMKNYDGLIVSWEQPGGAAQPTQDWIVVQGGLDN